MAKLDLGRLKRMVQNASDLTVDAREASEKDRDYYDGYQWTAEEEAILRRRAQPIITTNRIKRKVDAMVGIEQRMRADPRARPTSPEHEAGAEAATKALEFLDEATRFDEKRSSAFENLIVEGYGGVEVIVEARKGKLDVAVNRLRWEEIFFDPHSREKDFSDASYLGFQKWMTMDRAMEGLARVWQGKEEDLRAILSATMTHTDGDTYEDRPLYNSAFHWSDQRQKRVRVAQMYYRNAGVWYLSIFCGGGEIWNDVSPYQDEAGKPTCPIVLMTAYIDRENRRYGVVRSMISQQDEINKRRSKLLHQLNARQTMGIKGAVDSVAAMKRELARPDGHVELSEDAFAAAAQVAGMKPFEIVNQSDQAAGQFQLLQESKSEIDLYGPNPSLVGQVEQGASGRAIQAQQQAGMAELAPLYDSLRDWTVRVYRAMWERARQFWTDERWVRVSDSFGRPEWLAMNRTVGRSLAIDPATGMQQIVPVRENVVAEMDVEIVIEDAPDQVTLQAEQFAQLSQMAANGVPVPPEMLIKASNLPDKAELLEMMEQQRQQQMQVQMAMAEAENRRADMAAQAKAERDMAGAAKDAATAQKIGVDAEETAARARKTNVEAARLAAEPIVVRL